MDKIIVALDIDNEADAIKLVKLLYPAIKIFKVGNELFTACGPSVVQKIQALGAKVFLDLKFHDIPTTVKKSAEAAASLGVFIFNVHASGAKAMMQAAKAGAVEASKRSGKAPALVLAVTALTSLDASDLASIGVGRASQEQVLSLAALAKESGLDGVICSPQEISPLRKKFGKDFVILTPGVRPSWADSSDHKRFKTPKEAIQDGADFLVIGRPITQDKDPLKAAQTIIKEIEN